MPNVRDIAKQAGVSIATVSRVLNNHPSVNADVRERVLAAAGKSRYVSTVGRRSTSNIAFVYTGQPSLGSPFDAALMQGVSAGLESTNYDLLILDARRALRRKERYAQLFMRKGVRGAIIRTDSHTRQECARIVADNFPAVVVAEEFDDMAIPCVSADARAAVRRAVEHLIHLGHRRIAITLNIVDDHDHQQRLDAYRSAMSSAGVPVRDDDILRVPAYRDGGAVALRQLIGSPNRPTAVFVTDPMAAVGVFHEAQRMGVRIPHDLSVIGFDDGEQRFGVYPRMSAVCQDVERLGRDAFGMLLPLLKDGGGEPNGTFGHECWLELHESTAPPPSGASIGT